MAPRVQWAPNQNEPKKQSLVFVGPTLFLVHGHPRVLLRLFVYTEKLFLATTPKQGLTLWDTWFIFCPRADSRACECLSLPACCGKVTKNTTHVIKYSHHVINMFSHVKKKEEETNSIAGVVVLASCCRVPVARFPQTTTTVLRRLEMRANLHLGDTTAKTVITIPVITITIIINGFGGFGAFKKIYVCGHACN